MNLISRSIIFIVSLILLSCNPQLPTAKVTIITTDEAGKRLEGVVVNVGYQINSSSGTKVQIKSGKTDINGKFSCKDATNGHISFTAIKDGYYRSSGTYDFFEKKGASWMPLNQEVTLALRRVNNPIPMYARNTLKSPIEVPALNKNIGFDLVAYDWVAPFGDGQHEDFIFNLQREFTDRYNYEAQLTITFSNVLDGIQEVSTNERLDSSDFKMPRYAPETGYNNKHILTMVSTPVGIKRTHNEDSDYIFRVRSEVESSKVVKAVYGKIQGGLSFGVIRTETAYVGFKYYLNPDNTTNLEYDPSRNLFSGLKSFEEVGLR